MATTSSGELFAWGYGDGGWLGIDDNGKLPFYEQSEQPSNFNDGTSSKSSGILSRCCSFDSKLNILIPQLVLSASKYFVEKVVCGGAHTVLFCRDRDSKIDERIYNHSITLINDSESKTSSAAYPIQSKSDFKSSAVVEHMNENELTSHLISWCRHNKLLEVEYAISHGADINTVDSAGNTPLMVCCQNGNIDVCKLLLKYSANVHSTNFKGNTVLHYCFAYGFDDMGNMLISAGANEYAVNNEV